MDRRLILALCKLCFYVSLKDLALIREEIAEADAFAMARPSSLFPGRISYRVHANSLFRRRSSRGGGVFLWVTKVLEALRMFPPLNFRADFLNRKFNILNRDVARAHPALIAN